ncbi:MAG: helix-turn-helix transcriptional regulator [Beijerinckiaceae bacterium]
MQTTHGLYSVAQVSELTTLSRSTIYRKMEAGEFPSPVKVTGSRIAWRHADIHEWIGKLTGEGCE